MKADVTLDCLGLYCPMPIIKTSEKIRELTNGQILEIIADDPGIKVDMPNWCKMTGHILKGIEQKDDEYRVYIEKQEI